MCILSVRVASSNELDVMRNGFSIYPAITHDLFDETNGISGVSFIKEDNCVHI